jgi:hypothetical protein
MELVFFAILKPKQSKTRSLGRTQILWPAKIQCGSEPAREGELTSGIDLD